MEMRSADINEIGLVPSELALKLTANVGNDCKRTEDLLEFKWKRSGK